ncbi:hypothetical protein B0T22DRAFT_289896 [Podospora appendiculata]|uniref:Uncharacterized protein n=1 Tax=Podospora appendiculata TaxID=314037 RepID=A0AAE1C889_9PEZI|nr:hypothetical protein B0T22DRAFT_289896 [Podospora appendiculata]
MRLKTRSSHDAESYTPSDPRSSPLKHWTHLLDARLPSHVLYGLGRFPFHISRPACLPCSRMVGCLVEQPRATSSAEAGNSVKADPGHECYVGAPPLPPPLISRHVSLCVARLWSRQSGRSRDDGITHSLIMLPFPSSCSPPPPPQVKSTLTPTQNAFSNRATFSTPTKIISPTSCRASSAQAKQPSHAHQMRLPASLPACLPKVAWNLAHLTDISVNHLPQKNARISSG